MEEKFFALDERTLSLDDDLGKGPMRASEGLIRNDIAVQVWSTETKRKHGFDG